MQWTKQARQYLLREIQKDNHEFIKEIEENVIHTLSQQNAKRKQYGRPPQKRVTKEIIKQTIINIITDTNPGDNERNEINENREINYDFKGGMYT